MGILNFVKSQFIEVIEWVDDSQDTMVYRFPVENKEIKMGAKLTVRESQLAIFVNEGKAADVFSPGLYTLETNNLPILTKLRSWPYGFNSPFKAEVYFFNTRQYTDQKWGTENPIMLRDAEFGMLRLRGFGIYSFRISNPLVFLQQISGTNGLFDTQSITGQLKRVIVSGLTDLLGELKIPALDLASNYDEISEQVQAKLSPKFEAMGLTLVSFYVENISLPEEVEKTLDTRTQMGMLGNLQQYAQFQAANSIPDAAKNPGGLAGAGIGLGAGAVMGSAFMQAFNQPAQTVVSQKSVETFVKCPSCGAQVTAGTKFCPECGKPIVPAGVKCVKCGAPLKDGSKFCSECGAAQNVNPVCKNCSKQLEPGAKFCPDCGTKVE
ncbi:MAG TPA: SPFH domain-containing protein [Clostridia bacterium]|nr:SPFH domain-containing protein [Clostridia bacterium]